MWRHGLGWAVREKCLKPECLNAASTFQQTFGLAAVCLVLPIQFAAFHQDDLLVPIEAGGIATNGEWK